MHNDQKIYRELFEQLWDDNKPENDYDEIIVPWLERAGGERIWLADFAAMSEKPYPEVYVEDVWRTLCTFKSK